MAYVYTMWQNHTRPIYLTHLWDIYTDLNCNVSYYKPDTVKLDDML